MLKKMVSEVMIMLLVFGMLALLIHVKPAASTEDNWWNSNWAYRRQVNITENSGYSLINFPVEVSFRHDGHVQADGRDIRVVENNTEIPYCITKINSSWTTIMLESNLTSLSSKSIYIYYENPNATSPNYPLVPLVISEGQQEGNATIDDRIFIGWKYVVWGVQPGWYFVGGNLVYIDNNPVVLWTDFRMDFDNDGIFEENEDLITDFDLWKGGIGRYHMEVESFVERSFGLGDYQSYVRTPIYVDIVFQDVTLRVNRNHNFVETTQADRLQMEGSIWDYAKYENGIEENIIDCVNVNPDLWNILYNSSTNPGWMAYRNSLNGYIFGAIGFNINSTYSYYFPAKEAHAWDRLILFDYVTQQSLDPYNQPPECKIYWYADKTNGYSEINKTATILGNPPLVSVLSEEAVTQLGTTLTIGVPSAIIGKPVTLNATLRDENGNPIQGKNIEFQIYNGTSWSKIGSANTNLNGIASISYTPSSTGTFQVRAVFNGTSNYSQTTSMAGSLKVDTDFTPYYLIGAIVITCVCGTVGYVVYRRRKKPLS